MTWLLSLLAPFLRPLLIVGLSLALATGLWWYVGHLRAQVKGYQARIDALQATIEFQNKQAEIRYETRKEIDKAVDDVRSGDPARIADAYRRMRDKAAAPGH